MYRARRTLLIKFENDELDESPDIEKVSLITCSMYLCMYVCM